MPAFRSAPQTQPTESQRQCGNIFDGVVMLRSEHPGGFWVQHAEKVVWPGNRTKQEQQPGALKMHLKDPVKKKTGASQKFLRAHAAQTPRFPMACQARSNPAGLEATHGLPSTRWHWDHAVEHPSPMRRSLVVSHRQI